jgi:Ca-activated chloride channel family protein
LSGGWIKGIELVACEAKAGNVDAVLLLTDGQANLGIVDHAQLVAMGESVNREQGVRTSCLGLGRDFNEDLLKNIASAAGGRFHYIESPDHAPEVFQEVEEATCRLILGDFHDEQVKHVLLVAQLPAMTDLTDMLLASLKMNYAEIREGAIELKSQKQNLIVQIVDAADCAIPGDPEVLLHIGIQHAAQARQAAVAQLDKGDVAAATKVLEEQRDQLRSMAPQASEPDRLNAEAAELDHRARELREDQDVQGSRKFMVAECACLASTDYSATQSNRKRHNRPRGKA